MLSGAQDNTAGDFALGAYQTFADHFDCLHAEFVRLSNIDWGSPTQKPAELGRAVLLLLRDLLRFETQKFEFHESLPVLVIRLAAESAALRLFEKVHSDALQLIKTAQFSPESLRLYSGSLLSDVGAILDWYYQRKMSVVTLGLSLDQLPDAASARLFGIAIVEGRTWLDAPEALPGFEVISALMIKGFRSRALRLQLSFFENGAAVRVASGWESWSLNGQNFCHIFALFPRRSLAILDRIENFVPYAALALASGIHQLTLRLSLLSEDGRTLAENSVGTVLHVPGKVPALPCLPAPQQAGFWPNDPERAEKLTNLVVEQGEQLRQGENLSLINVSFDLTCVDRDDRPDGLKIECRILDRHLERVNSANPNYSDDSSDFQLSFDIRPDKPLKVYRNLRLQFPTTALQLNPGTFEGLVEIVLLNPDRRVILGALQHFEAAICGQTDNNCRPRSRFNQGVTIEALPANIRNGGGKPIREGIDQPSCFEIMEFEAVGGRLSLIYRIKPGETRFDGCRLHLQFFDSNRELLGYRFRTSSQDDIGTHAALERERLVFTRMLTSGTWAAKDRIQLSLDSLKLKTGLSTISAILSLVNEQGDLLEEREIQAPVLIKPRSFVRRWARSLRGRR